MNEEQALIAANMCMAEHPILKVMCLRNKGHDGKHWFMARWDQGATRESVIAEILQASHERGVS